jgi:hypothetical protein
MFRLLLSCCLLVALGAHAESRPEDCCTGTPRTGSGPAPIAASAVVELSGTISVVHTGAGQGESYVDVRTGGESTRLQLGAMHFLIARDFNPKAGQPVVATGYRTPDGVVAILVSLPAEKKTVRFRDENGRPLWRGGQGRSAAPAR